MPVKITQDQMMMLLIRIKMNLEETGHPMHHRVGDGSGTIVDADPTLEHMIEQLNPLTTVPVNRTRYGFDLYSENGDK